MADPDAPRTGWFKGPSGSVMHADGPDQLRVLTDRGWTAITEQQAKDIIAAGTHLTVQSDVKGTFDADAVGDAIRNESTGHAARSAAARKAADTRRRNKAAAQANADGITAEG
jgi:hypothetical protein